MSGRPATDQDCYNMIAEYWNAKESLELGRDVRDRAKARKRLYEAARWIGGGVDLRPYYGRIPTLDQLDERRRRLENQN